MFHVGKGGVYVNMEVFKYFNVKYMVHGIHMEVLE